MSESFMEAVLGTSSRIEVSIAWGADLTTGSLGWTWTDITNKVFVENGINVTVGRGDEAQESQPAKCAFTVDNSDAGFSLGGLSPNWPNVRRNTPVRVRVDPDGSGFSQVFLGYVDTFTPAWDSTGTVATTEITASGVIRRLLQNTVPSTSSLRRAISQFPDLVAYWPLEDGKLATAAGSGIVGKPAMVNNVGLAEFSKSSDVFIGSGPLPEMNNAWLGGDVAGYASSLEAQVSFLLFVPDADSANEAPLCSVFSTTGMVFDVVWVAGAVNNLRVLIRDRFGTIVQDSQFGFDIRGIPGLVILRITQDGADIDWEVIHVEARDGTAAGSTGVQTEAGQTWGNVKGVLLNGGGFHDEVVMGHVIVENNLTSPFTLGRQLVGYTGDSTWSGGTSRLQRLATENALSVDVASTSNLVTDDDIDNMGPQPMSTLMPLLREVETTEQGFMHDGVGSDGLRFIARKHIENQDALFTVNATDLVLGAPIADDQGVANRVRVQQAGGSTADAEDIDGPMGNETIGLYDQSATISLYRSVAPLQYAHWLLHKGTIEGYRYPQLGFDVAGAQNSSAMASNLADLLPGSRIDVIGYRSVFPQHPDGTVSLLVQGYTHTFTSTSWKTTVNVSPFEAHRIPEIATESGDTNEFLFRLESDGATLTDAEAVGSTTFRFTTPSGPLWTTVADDFPFDIEVGGIRVRVTAISGASSPQTVTVAPATVTKALPAGAAVKIWKQTVLGL